MAIDLNNISNTEPLKNQSKSKMGTTQSGKSRFFKFNTYSNKDKSHLYHHFSVLFGSGIEIDDVLKALIKSEKKKRKKEVLSAILKDLYEGFSFSESMNRRNEFSVFEIVSLKVAEETGDLNGVFRSMSNYFEKIDVLRKKLRKTIITPVFHFLLLVFVFVFYFQFMLPMMASQSSMGEMDPESMLGRLTRFKEFVALYYPVGLGGIVAIGLFLIYARNKEWYKKSMAHLILRIPNYGTLVKNLNLMKAYELMYLLTKSKAPLDYSLKTTSEAVSFYPVKDAFYEMNTAIKEGQTLLSVAERNSVFDDVSVMKISTGEMANKLDETFLNLLNINKSYTDELISKTEKFVEFAFQFVLAILILLLIYSQTVPMINNINLDSF